MKVTKAVIPAAGLGTRVLPATKAQPKEMLVIVDKPSLWDIVVEADINIVTGRNKSSKVLAYNFEGKRYDIGNKFGLLKANIEFGLRNEETREELLEYLKNI